MRFWLPLLSLLLWVLLVAVPVTLTYTNFASEARGAATVTLKAGAATLTLRHDQLLKQALRFGTWTQHDAIAAINLPAFAVDLLLSRAFSSWPASWAPAGIDSLTWRAISFPIFCLPFWWFEGLGIDGLLKQKKFHWGTLLLGTLLWGFFVFLLVGLRLSMSPEERADTAYPFLGFGLWVLLLSVFPVGWIMRFRSRRSSET